MTLTATVAVQVEVRIEPVNHAGIEPPAFLYDGKEITKTGMLVVNHSRIGYVGYCADTREWLAFNHRGEAWSSFGKTRAAVVERFVAYR